MCEDFEWLTILATMTITLLFVGVIYVALWQLRPRPKKLSSAVNPVSDGIDTVGQAHNESGFMHIIDSDDSAVKEGGGTSGGGGEGS